MKEIKLTQGKVALVDDADFEWLSQWKWYVIKNRHTYYAMRSEYNPETGKAPCILMHRVILNASRGILVDHKDNNGLNNQRFNLRFADHSQNGINRRKQSNNTSGHTGVRKCNGRWRTSIKVNRRTLHVGMFNTFEEAARAYTNAAQKHFGSYVEETHQAPTQMMKA